MTDRQDNLESLLSQADQVSKPRRGDLLQGCILSIDAKGAIIDLGVKRDGVVPETDLAALPSDEADIKVGDEISVMVIDPLDRDGNLVVSIAQARESGDWIEAHRLMDTDEIIEVEPFSFNRGGLIVPFGRLRGFVPASHVSEIPRGLDEDTRGEYLQKLLGRKIPLKVIEVDPRRRRLVFSERKAIRQWRQERKAEMIRQLQVGENRKGVVTSLREFGAFVDIGGADGLIHISELSWNRVEDPAQIVSIGQEIEAKVILLDRQTNRIGLSLKRMVPSPWDAVGETFAPGQTISGVVSHLAAVGVYVQVENGPEGLLRPPDGPGALLPGTRVLVRVIALEPERERLDLELVEIEASTDDSEPIHDILTEGGGTL